MTWHGVVGFCSFLSGILAYVTTALPAKWASLLALVGAVLIAVDRFALAHENAAGNSVPTLTGKQATTTKVPVKAVS